LLSLVAMPAAGRAPADHRPIGGCLRSTVRVSLPVPRPIVRNSGPLGWSRSAAREVAKDAGDLGAAVAQ